MSETRDSNNNHIDREVLNKNYLYQQYIVYNKTQRQIAEESGWALPTVIKCIRKFNIERDKNLKDKIFGKLTVLSFAGMKGPNKNWECRCECGVKVFRTTSYFSRCDWKNRSPSCGECIKLGENAYNWNGYKEITGSFWKRIIISAKERSIGFELEREYIWELYEKQNRKCNLSGLPIIFCGNSTDTTASLDRIDSTKDYIKGNVQWVHKDINIMKNTYNQDYFINLCSLISENNGRIFNRFVFEKVYDLDEISIVPKNISRIESRKICNTNSEIYVYNIDIPIITSPMPDVCDSNVAKVIGEHGGCGILHRFSTIDHERDEFLLTKRNGDIPVICAIGANGDFLERFDELYINGCRMFCIDIANGFSVICKNAIGSVLNKHGDIFLIAGNVASKEGFEFLSKIGVGGVRCGIAGGSKCSTKTETGIFNKMASTINECYNVKTKLKKNTLIIADGGIKNPGQMAKAIALGADFVLIGSLIAACEESPARTINRKGIIYKEYRGASSWSVQNDSGKTNIEYIEGNEDYIKMKGNIPKLLKRFKRGLQSSMSYLNARNLTEYRANVDWVKV